MKLSLTLHGKIYSVESENEFDDEQVSEVVEQFKGLLVNAGYHPQSVDPFFNTEYQWFDKNKDEWNNGSQSNQVDIDTLVTGKAFYNG